MKPASFCYHAPSSLDEAVDLRRQYPGAPCLAGGQSLIPMMNFRLAQPEHLIDLGGVDELAFVSSSSNDIRVGAMTRQRQLERDPDAYRSNPLIRETLRLVAHPVIRNRGTVGGSVAHADASAELPTLFMCLGGTAEVAGPLGHRAIPSSSFFSFHLTTTMEPEELLTSLSFPVLQPGTGWAFEEVSRRHGDFALAGVCCTLRLHEDGHVDAVRLAACGIDSVPRRLETSEDTLVGEELTDGAVREAAKAARDYVTAADETQASRSYRCSLVETLVGRALRVASLRAGHHGRPR